VPVATFTLRHVLALWSKARPPVQYPPLQWDWAVSIAVQMARAGFYRFAVGTLLTFDCLLRCGELLSLRRADVADAGDSRLGAEYRVMIVAIRQAKTERNQSVTVLDEDVKALLRPLLRSTSDSDILFPGGARLFRSMFKAVCLSLGLSSGFVPHSLRHGGVTHLHTYSIGALKTSFFAAVGCRQSLRVTTFSPGVKYCCSWRCRNAS
jgi:integrase